MPDYFLRASGSYFRRSRPSTSRPASLERMASASPTVQMGGVPETIPESFGEREVMIKDIEERTMLKRPATLDDVGNVAALAASHQAPTMTVSGLDITCGAELD
jgi:enoyl-[acyl-carrier-protein] reductase (NADH)